MRLVKDAPCGKMPPVMPKLIRTLLLALLAVVVPIQGAFAVSAAQCLALEHHQDDAAQEVHEHAPDDQQGHHASAPLSQTSDGHMDHSHATSDDGDDAGSHCGPCVACCSSVSIAASVRVTLITPQHTAVTVLPYFPPIGGLPNGLDRPPLAL